MSSQHPYNRSWNSAETGRGPHLKDSMPVTPSGVYLSSTRPASRSSSTSHPYATRKTNGSAGNSGSFGFRTDTQLAPASRTTTSSSGMSRSQSTRQHTRKQTSAHSVMPSRNVFDDYWANENATTVSNAGASYPSATTPTPTSGMLLAQSRQRELASTGRNVFDHYRANKDASAIATSENHFRASNTYGNSRPSYIDPQLTTQKQTPESRSRTEISRSQSINGTSQYGTSRTGTQRLTPYAQSQVDRLNEAQSNGTSFEEYWKGLDQSMRTTSRRSSRSRDRALDEASRNASRGGIGFREWWTQETGNLMDLRREEDAMLAERNSKYSRSRMGRSDSRRK